MATLAVHKTFEKGEDQKRQVMLFVSDGRSVQKVNGAKASEWAAELPPDTTLRFTAVHACDKLLADLASREHRVEYAHWHSLGLDRNMAPEQIALAFANSTAEFREFQPRPDLVTLRYRVSQRLAIVEFRKAVILRLRGAELIAGITTEEDMSDEVKLLLDQAMETETRVPVTGKNGKEKMVSLDTVIGHLCENIRECVLFNSAAHIEGWGTAATVVAFSGGIDRFDTVAAFWHYCGEHVVDGKAPKRAKGKAMDWNPKIRTALWQLSSSILKNRNNPWRSVYEQYLAEEQAQHETKHPGCKTPKGHCIARALRKIRKDILKRFFLDVKGEEYSESRDHRCAENQTRGVAA